MRLLLHEAANQTSCVFLFCAKVEKVKTECGGEWQRGTICRTINESTEDQPVLLP